MRAAARIGMSKRSREKRWPAWISVDGMDVGKLCCAGWKKGGLRWSSRNSISRPTAA
jgi:hypothetical protein